MAGAQGSATEQGFTVERQDKKETIPRATLIYKPKCIYLYHWPSLALATPGLYMTPSIDRHSLLVDTSRLAPYIPGYESLSDYGVRGIDREKVARTAKVSTHRHHDY